MRDNMDELLTKALTPMDMPKENVNARILGKIKEEEDMNNRIYKRKISAAVVAVLCVFAVGSITATAAYHYLSPAKIAAEVEDDVLQNAFLSEDAILVNETQESGGYKVTLLGSTMGKNISSYLTEDENGNVEEDKIYTVVAMERADGTPMPDTSSDEYGKEVFYVSHYIQGLNPNTYSIMSMGGGYQEFVKNGIQYRILEMDNIEMFADKEIYVGVSSGTFYDADAYVYDESSGKMTRNEKYEGVNALFVLPIDESKANPEAAAAYLEEFEHSLQKSDEPLEQTAADLSVEEFMAKLTAENIDEYAEPVESTRQVCVPDENGFFSYSYELESGAGGNGTVCVSVIFPEGEKGMCPKFDYSYSEGGLKDLRISVYTLNEDGTVTHVIYVPKR